MEMTITGGITLIISRMRSKISLKEPMASRKGRNMGIKRPKRVYISG